jgi:Carboxypeptidase regulatory-like domain
MLRKHVNDHGTQGDAMRRSFTSRPLSIAAVVACLLALTSRPAAAQEELGYYIGTITSAATGEPIADACVQAYATPADVVGSGCTASDGRYTFSVPMGTYRLRVFDLNRNFATRWAYTADSYDSATPIPAGAGLGTVVDVALLPAGAIAGTVTDETTGQPVYACVEVMPVGLDEFAAYTCTDDRGQYRAVVTEPGQYHVHFTASYYVDEWANNRSTRELADAVTVSAGQDTAVDAQLTPLGQIAGRVTDLAGNPLAFMRIEAVDANEFGWSTETDYDGNYRLRGLPAGQYQVLFVDRTFGNYVAEWWNDSPDRAHADPVTVALASEVSGINAALGTSGLITGTITDATTGEPLYGVCVRAVLAATGEPVEGAYPQQCTGVNGRYELNAVGGSSYKVQFQPTDPTYLSQWYRNKTSEKSANRIRVQYGQTVPGIDAALHPAG